MPQPRIAIVAASLDILGGQGVQACHLVDALNGEGYRVTFLPVNPRLPRRLARARSVRYVRTVVNQSLYLPSLTRLADVDVAHVFSASYASFLLAPVPAMLAARLFARRVVLHYHSGEAEDHLANWGALVHPWLRLADRIVVPSRYLAGVFGRHGYAARVIPNVVDTSRFAYRPRVPLRPRLLSVRNLEPPYKVDVILEAFARIKARVPDATLTVAGYGSEDARLRRMGECLGARFVGRVEPPQMPALLDGADIFLNASVVDNQPVSILEAFAAGLTVVSTPTGDIASMVRHGSTGLLVPPDAPDAMAEAVCMLLADSHAACEMTARARREVRRHTWSEIRSAWADVYRAA